jgi:hypothetical protein
MVVGQPERDARSDLVEPRWHEAVVEVADVQTAFQVSNMTLVDGTPVDVVRECQWTWVCTRPPLGPDIHANTDGYGVIAQAFEQALP